MKKVFIGVLAALMLFAFTACEQSMPSYKQVEYVTLDQTQAFIEYQPLSAEAFSVTVHYLDGSQDVFPGTGRVTFVDSAADNANVVSNATAKAGVYAKATVAGESDTIGIKFVEATAFTATVTAEDVIRSYAQVGSTDEYAPKEAAVTFKVTGATLTGDENASWTLTSTEATSKINVPNDVKLTSEEQLTVGAVEKEVTLSLKSDEEIKYATTVSVNVKANTTDSHDPEYEATITPNTITKNEVVRLGVVWAAGVKNGDFKPTGDNGATPAKYDLEDVDTTGTHTIQVGETVEFTLVGLAEDMTNKLPLVLAATTDYAEVGTGTIEATPTDKGDITDLVVGDADPIPALTATYQFKPGNTGSEPNFGTNAKITLTVTVTDKITISNPQFVYNGSWDDEENKTTWKAGTLTEGQAVQLSTGDFTAQVKTEGGEWVQLVADEVYGPDKDKLVYEEGELKAGTPVKVIVSWSYDDEVLGGPFSGKAEISISVNKASV